MRWEDQRMGRYFHTSQMAEFLWYQYLEIIKNTDVTSSHLILSEVGMMVWTTFILLLETYGIHGGGLSIKYTRILKKSVG